MSDDKPGESRPDDETQPVRPGGGATLPSAPAAAPGSESPAGAEP
ncbi:MAG: hypothetical protein JWN97_228, partial [Nocardioides sp.]|nr:hypothetical protein [Nocardioides sp.]